MTNKKFKEKVKSMKFSEIMQAMIDGLRNPIVEIDMSVYRSVKGNICFGCAATCAVLNIQNRKKVNVRTFLKNTEPNYGRHSDSACFIGVFESAIDSLRNTFVCSYNSYAYGMGISPIPKKFITKIVTLPELRNCYTNNELDQWQAVCDQIKKHESRKKAS